MNTPTPTPRTDDNEDGWAYNFQYDSFCSLIDDPLPWAEFSRTLERELTTVTEQLTAAREELVETRKDFMCLAELLDGHDATECRMNLVRLKEQRDRLEEALANIARQNLSEEMDDHSCERADWQGGYESIVKIAREAL